MAWCLVKRKATLPFHLLISLRGSRLLHLFRQNLPCGTYRLVHAYFIVCISLNWSILWVAYGLKELLCILAVSSLMRFIKIRLALYRTWILITLIHFKDHATYGRISLSMNVSDKLIWLAVFLFLNQRCLFRSYVFWSRSFACRVGSPATAFLLLDAWNKVNLR